MKRFSSVAIPHRDIIEGRLTMDVFAADLWQVYKGTAPEEYGNPEIFFKKTYMTSGLKNLMEIAKKRLDGHGGDAVIQLFTPFGGGKTHSLIALFHKAKEWGAKTVVIDGIALEPDNKHRPETATVWGEIERQLTGKVDLLQGMVSPGKEKLGKLLSEHQPLLILMDEVLHYATRAAGIKVGDSNLASQLVAFIHSLTEAVKATDRTLLVLTLPSSVLEHYDENAEKILGQLQKIAGRAERVYTPVQEEEISEVIRRRLFSRVDEIEARKMVDEFLDYVEAEGILPEGYDITAYREKFLKSYPFLPEVIDVLYKRWGSYPTFQRTRGVLRILALVVNSLRGSSIPFIRLSNFDLKNPDIRRELIKHIGQEYDSIIAADITSADSGAKKVDRSLGDAYIDYNFGTKAATAIFMYSFSGGPEKGATVKEIKLSVSEIGVPSSIVSEAVAKLKEELFYISDDGLYFTNKPNLNRIVLNKMEGIDDRALVEKEEELLKGSLSNKYFECYVWPFHSKDVPDNRNLKLVILKDFELMANIFETCGERPRVFRNTLIFLTHQESERFAFENFLRKKIAWQLIDNDHKLELTEEQKKLVKENLKKAESEIKERIRRLYRKVYLPSKESFEEYDLGIPTVGAIRPLDEEIYVYLKSQEKLLERIDALFIREKFLSVRDYAETQSLVESFYRTPGEVLIFRNDVIVEAIRDGVKRGIFGLGKLEDGIPVCHYINCEVTPSLEGGEIITKKELCTPKPSVDMVKEFEERIDETDDKEELLRIIDEIKNSNKIDEANKKRLIEKAIKKIEFIEGDERNTLTRISLKLSVPPGKLSDVTRIVNYLSDNFENVEVVVNLHVDKGELKIHDYMDRVKEGLRQAGIEVKDESLE